MSDKKTKSLGPKGKMKVRVIMDIEFDSQEAIEKYNFSSDYPISKRTPENVASAYIEAISRDLKPFTFYGLDLNISAIHLVGEDSVLIKVPKENVIN